ncbi:MAG: 30S ribosomal protein S4e [Methanobacteriota archaeon]|nr:MAG: 30S ribosomal protein S4e [Euryarchaeota archaeon]
MAKKHLKRLPAPRSWKIERKTAFWTMKPSPGPHPVEESVPVGLVLRDMLKVCDTAREARAILGSRTVFVDGRTVTDPKLGVGVMDVVALQATKEHYRMLVDSIGRLHLVPIDAEQAQWKLCRIEGKTTQRGGVTQVNLHDGRNLLLPKNEYATGTTLKVGLPKQGILGTFPMEPGATALLIGGQHVGEIGHVERVEATRNPRANVVHFTEGFSTDVTKVFVIGRATPEIAIPEKPAIEVRA